MILCNAARPGVRRGGAGAPVRSHEFHSAFTASSYRFTTVGVKEVSHLATEEEEASR
jgi:hypothetical protein